MIFRFAIDPEALGSDLDTGRVDTATRAAHERVIDCWRDYGILVTKGPYGKNSPLIKVVQSLPEELRIIWEKAFKKNRIVDGGPNWAGLGGVQDLRDLEQAGKFVDVACFSPKKAQTLLGMGMDQWSMFPHSNLEVCLFGYLDRSKAFQSSKETAHCSLEKGTLVKTVWRRHFASLERLYTSVCLIDRYAVASHHYCKYIARITSGLEFLINKLGRGSRPHELTIVTGTTDQCSEQTAKNLLKQLAGRPQYEQLKEVVLFLADDTLFSTLVHYRSLRFGRIFCQLDTGIEVLEGQQVKRTCNFHVMDQTGALDREEDIIKKATLMDVICRRPMKIKPA